MKAVLWIYAVVGTIYFWMYLAGMDVVVRNAVGLLWLMMVVAPVILFLLVFFPIAQGLGLFDK